MKIFLIVYSISWLILLAIFLFSFFQKREGGTNPFKEKEPWYLYALIILLAPIVVLLVPYILFDDFRKNRRQRKENITRKYKHAEEQKHREDASVAFALAATNRDSVKATFDQIVVASSLVALAKIGQYDNFLKCLDRLSLPQGLSLYVEKAKQDGMGDISKLYIKSNSTETNYNFFEELLVDDSCDGAWQAYLLYSLWHILPTFWHGGYDSRTYIFSKEDLKNIHTIQEKDQGVIGLIVDFNLNPEIAKSDKNGKYYVSCCYWSDWGGLIRELVEITIENNRVIDVFEVAQQTEYEYDCGILF